MIKVKGKGKVTSLDIALLAGVSQPTVSRALRADPAVNPHTRRRILDIARQLNYRADKNTSSLRLHTAHTLALLFYQSVFPCDAELNHPHLGPAWL